MKKKNLTINKLALGNLKQRRKQYTILIIGIILAMVFSSSTLFFLSSSSETFKEKEFDRMGKQQEIYSVFDDDESIYSKAITDGVLTDYALAHIIGFGYTNGDKMPGTAIAWLDDKCKELSNQSFIEGSYPVNENEIAIEKTALSKLGIDAKIGDDITLTVDVQSGEGYSGTVEKTYKLVGIVTDKRQNLDFYSFNSDIIPAAFVAQGTKTELGGREILSAYVMRPDDVDTYDYIFRHSKVGYCSLEYHNAYSFLLGDSLGGITGSGKYITVIAIVLIFVSCIAIVNAFNTNLKERKKQIGMLRAVGATKRQIIKIFGREAFIISLICTPISIAISYGIVRLAIFLMNEEAVMTKSISVLLVSGVVCIIVTMLSALIPLIYASRITPMQAIRNIENNRRMNTKKIRSNKDFDVPSLLAKRSTQFYKGGKIAVSSILIATIIFSCIGFSYINFMKEHPSYSGYWDYELSNMADGYALGYTNGNPNGMSEADKRDIDAYPYFSHVISQKNISALLEVDEITDYYRCFYEINWWIDYLEEDTENFKEYVDSISRGKNILPVPVYSFDQQTVKMLESSLSAGKIDYDKLASGEEIILLAPQSVKYAGYLKNDHMFSNGFYDGEAMPENYTIINEGGEIPYSVGDTINLSVIEDVADSEEDIRTDREVTIGAIVSPAKLNDELSYIFYFGDFAFITTHSGMQHFSENAKYQSIYIHANPDMELDGDIDKTISEYMEVFHNRYGGFFESTYAYNQDMKDTTNFLLVAMISIVLIGFVVCAAIINNSLTASIREKKKEIGTLRAVGADIKVLVNSYIRQLLSMLGFGYGIGFAAFGIIYALLLIIYKLVNYDYDFVFSPWETLAFGAVLFAVCSFNLWSKVRKEMKNSIVDNIREL